jgi:hypothetical protein
MIFELLCVAHVLLWVFVMTAFLDKKLAYYNVYIVIPLIFISHMFSGCVLIDVKEKLDSESKIRQEQFDDFIAIPNILKNLQNSTGKRDNSPFSTQGMMIFGLITSIFVLHPPNYLIR